METLFAPWRMAYIANSDRHDGCIFCDFPREDRDAERLIIHRGQTCFVMLNAFPYNPCHLMVAPYRHTCDYPGLSDQELLEMHRLAGRGIRLLDKVVQPQGYNMGVNLGRIAGAGIDEHLHLHIVPRWSGDCNFMPVLSGTRVLPEALNESYAKLKEVWDLVGE